jgi:hypothetical protein
LNGGDVVAFVGEMIEGGGGMRKVSVEAAGGKQQEIRRQR